MLYRVPAANGSVSKFVDKTNISISDPEFNQTSHFQFYLGKFPIPLLSKSFTSNLNSTASVCARLRVCPRLRVCAARVSRWQRRWKELLASFCQTDDLPPAVTGAVCCQSHPQKQAKVHWLHRACTLHMQQRPYTGVNINRSNCVDTEVTILWWDDK